MPPSDPIRARALLEQAGWIQNLARSLVSDPHLADDLSQDVLLSALQRPPEREGPIRRWLAGILRNLVAQERRCRGRRLWRETEVARPLRTANDSLELVGAHERLARAVRELKEPYRSVIVQRFFEGLTPRRIADESRTPLATVKSRITRGLAMLRRKIERPDGAGARWVAVLLPILRRPGLPAKSLAWTLVMSTTLKILLPCASVVGLLFWWSTDETADTGDPQPAWVQAQADGEASSRLANAASDAPPSLEDEPHRTGERNPRETVQATPRPDPVRASAPTAVPVVRGRVFDTDASPVAGLAVGLFDWETRDGESAPQEDLVVVSDGEGRFEVGFERAGTLRAADPAYATVLAAKLHGKSASDQIVVVVAPRIEVAGRVLDVEGRPLSDARVILAPGTAFRERLEPLLHHSSSVSFEQNSSANGEFHFEQAPGAAGSILTVSCLGFVTATLDAPLFTELGVQVVLERTGSGARTLRGVVLDPEGRPVPAAFVALRGEVDVSARTDAEGLFRLPAPDEGRSGTVQAAARGFLPAEEVVETTDRGSFLELRLESLALAIGGRVVDGEGSPVPGAIVYAADPTWFGEQDDEPIVTESILIGEPDLRIRTASDEDGRFRLEGLLERAYDLRALLPETGLIVERPRVHAGTEDVVLELPSDPYRPTLRGRVVDLRGSPLSGVNVRVEVSAFRFPTPDGPAPGYGIMHPGSSTSTDAEGRFQLEDVPRGPISIFASASGFDRTPFELPDTNPEQEVVIRVPQRVNLRVEASADKGATAFSLRDASGEPLGLTQRVGTGYTRSDWMNLVEGRSEIVSCSELARTIVLWSGDDLLAERPVLLLPGELNVLRP